MSLTDIDWEVSLLKIQIREEKKEDATCQSLKKDIDQLRNQIGQVEAKLTVKMEQSAPALSLVSILKLPQFYLPPHCARGLGMVIFLTGPASRR